MPLTIKNRKDFVENVTKLSLWLTGKYYDEGMQFEEALTKATPVYRFTILWNGKNHPAEGFEDIEWNKLLKEIKKIYLQKDSIEQFEKEGLELLNPVLQKRYERDVKAWPWIPSTLGSTNLEERLSGMFLYEITEKKELDLHMGNIYAPETPFKNMKLLANSLLLLIGEVQKKNPIVKKIVCESWMNSFTPFLSLFPKEWCEQSSKTNMKNYTYDIWGQMMNRHGGYHKPNGNYLRINGRFLYPSIKCGCSINFLLQHLQNIVN